MSSSLHALKSSFREVFPSYAAQLDRATSQAEIHALHKRFMAETVATLHSTLAARGGEAVGTGTDQTAPIALTHKQYLAITEASGDGIESQLHVLLDGTARLKGMEADDAAVVTAQLVISGAIAIGGIALKASARALVAQAVETAAAYAGVEAASVALVCAIAAVVIVAIIIPIIYFMEKPANCLVLVINELDDDLVFAGDHCTHGKSSLVTTPIPAAVAIPGHSPVYVAGFVASAKNENALVGSQYGFSFKANDQLLSFGVECPLTSIYVDNNCYCGIGIDAATAASKTDSANKTSYSASANGIGLSIKCNSGSGSIAYYVARAYKS